MCCNCAKKPVIMMKKATTTANCTTTKASRVRTAQRPPAGVRDEARTWAGLNPARTKAGYSPASRPASRMKAPARARGTPWAT